MVILSMGVVVNEAMKLLTEENIKLIASRVSKLSEKDPSGARLKDLQAKQAGLTKKIRNLVKAIEDGSGSQIIYDQLAQRENELSSIQDEIVKASVQVSIFSEKEVIDYLESFRNGNIDSPELRKSVIDLLINKVIISDTTDKQKKITIVCNAHNGNGEDVTITDNFGGSSNNNNGDNSMCTPTHPVFILLFDPTNHFANQLFRF